MTGPGGHTPGITTAEIIPLAAMATSVEQTLAVHTSDRAKPPAICSVPA